MVAQMNVHSSNSYPDSDENLQENMSNGSSNVLNIHPELHGFNDDMFPIPDEERQYVEKCSANPIRSIEGWIIIVTGLHDESIEDDIIAAFEPYGAIKNIHLNLDRRSGYVKGYSLIEFEHFKEAESAINGMNGASLLGNTIQVNWAFTKSKGFS